MSHDLRSPLNVAKGRLELVDEECDSDHVPVVGEALTRMHTIVEDTLTLAHQGRTVDEARPIDLADLVDRSWEQVTTDGATVELVEEITIRGDAPRVRTVFENLFRNAVEHGSTSPRSHAREDAVEHGSTSPRSHAREDAVEHDGEKVAVRVGALDEGFYVEDDGSGIPDDRGRLFEVGYSTAEEGTGFGLSIVQEIVQAHGWDVDVTHSEAGGARFEFTGVEFA